MRRCISLALLGKGATSPNPLVGAVLVCNNRIIGEGYHEKFGGAHAEVNCLSNVSEDDLHLICQSTLYISLEPCSHHGKTPPCTDLIIKYKIPRVVIGCRDSFAKVNGSGITKLISAGIDTEVGILENECRAVNKNFFTFHEKQRPYIILKWAQSKDGFIAGVNKERTKISNCYTNRLVHKWRAEEAAIAVGINTVLKDNPSLTVRHWGGKNPVRVIIDIALSADAGSLVFDDNADTLVINTKNAESIDNVTRFKIKEDENVCEGFLRCMHEMELTSVIIEGGSKTIDLFLSNGMWDEARVITGQSVVLKKGVPAPVLSNEISVSYRQISDDNIIIYKNPLNEFL